MEKNFADIFLLDNKDSKEVILTVNYTKDEMWNGEGNPMHMYSTGSYTNQPGMIRESRTVDPGHVFVRHFG